MAIKHSDRHRTRWKIIELRSANAKKHFALFFVVVVAAQSSSQPGHGGTSEHIRLGNNKTLFHSL